jgi:hypothetical protein
MNTPLIRRPDGNGASAEAVPAVPAASDGYPLPATWRGIGAQAAAALGMLTGLWVAISPWFITLQYAGGNAAAVNLISGLAVAAVGAFALAGPRGFAGLQSGSALLGVWLIIAGPILNHKHPIADSMYWSNSWAGGVLIALAAAISASCTGSRPACSGPTPSSPRCWAYSASSPRARPCPPGSRYPPDGTASGRRPP